MTAIVPPEDLAAYRAALAKAKERIAGLLAAQAGAPQTCAFCGTVYVLAETDAYRPGSVCCECWPAVSMIERRS